MGAEIGIRRLSAPIVEIEFLNTSTSGSGQGKTNGATLTLTKQHGGFLIAFLAIFVGMVGKSFWRLSCFAFHRYLSSSKEEDGLYHQRQAILRNSDTAQDGAWRLFDSMLSWRSGRRASRPIIRLLPFIFVALIISAAFGVASIFSSRVTTDTENEVLLTGKRCGMIDPAMPHERRLALLNPYYAKRASDFLNYGDKCYTNASNTDGCHLYSKQRLPLVSSTNATCPFGNDICKLKDGNLVLDTGYINSLQHLGINLPAKERFEFRMVHQCAPLKTEGYMELHNDSRAGQLYRYYYGSNLLGVDLVNGTRWTHEIPIDTTQYRPTDGTSRAQIPRPEYRVGLAQAWGSPDTELLPRLYKSWNPIPALRRTDADVNLIYLSGLGIGFTGPVDDPWFAAHKPAGHFTQTATNTSVGNAYVSDEPAGHMACTSQFQFCNPSLSHLPAEQRCEPLRGMIDPRKMSAISKIFTDKKQLKNIGVVMNILEGGYFTMNNFIAFMGNSALRARYGLSYGVQGPLPSNQWQIEAEGWAKGTLASIQDAFVTNANGLPDVLSDYLVPFAKNETTARRMCGGQKIVSTAYSSFSVLGVSLILAIGILIIAFDLGTEPTVAWWQRRRFARAQKIGHPWMEKEGGHPLHSVLEWSQTATLQLQRLAHEEAGYGKWEKCDGDCPVTGTGQKLGVMSLDDMKHPVFKTPHNKELASRNFAGMDRSDTGVDTLVGSINLSPQSPSVESFTATPSSRNS
ncbi:hypothetical protein P154DRAFT_586672 [Amniculicola lignicola CBS 123094]|uniref:Uncharacterized protein n=1 Tax=Amniculicola lignicola CBS 123094 TaxID=1392246 RepID=A0A6A5VZV4_9PLEO|nr:hypothetical protein P154DRAFT_586672 [Amniculicola lignicola CBS 123094]